MLTTLMPLPAVAQTRREPPEIRLLRGNVSTVNEWEAHRREIHSNVEKVMGRFPGRHEMPLDMVVLTDRIEDAIRRRKVSYHTDSEFQSVHAWLLSPAKPLPRKIPAMLCLHQTVTIGKDEPAGLGGNPHLHYALELARRGYVTLAPDYPSFGDYDYDFTVDTYESGSMKAISDNLRAVDLLQSLPEVDPDAIGVIGHSLGGHNAIFTAFFEPRLKAVVSCCGFTRFHRYYGGNLRGWTSERYMPRIAARYGSNPDQMPFDFPELIAGLAPRAFLAVAPVEDGNFEVTGVRETIQVARTVYQLYEQEAALQAIYPDAQHDFPDEARKTAYQFLDQQLMQNRAER